jgi:GNAT superfamily N-acetyltransferase
VSAASATSLDRPALLVAASPEPEGPLRSQVVVRRARRADVPALGRLDVVLPEHQAMAPVFSAGRRPTIAQATAEWEESLDDERFTTFVAELDGDVVGSAIGCALSASSLHTGLAKLDDAAFLGFAAVLPEARGRGVARALGEAVVDWAGDQGYRSVVTDWRATNLQASRTWPRLGFEPTFLRLHRLIGR